MNKLTKEEQNKIELNKRKTIEYMHNIKFFNKQIYKLTLEINTQIEDKELRIKLNDLCLAMTMYLFDEIIRKVDQ